MMLMTDPDELKELNPSFSGLFYWSYVGVVSIMMMNILLAIVVDAFESIRANENEETFFETLFTDAAITSSKFRLSFVELCSKHSSSVKRRKTLRVMAMRESSVRGNGGGGEETSCNVLTELAATKGTARRSPVGRETSALDSDTIKAADLDDVLKGVAREADGGGAEAAMDRHREGGAEAAMDRHREGGADAAMDRHREGWSFFGWLGDSSSSEDNSSECEGRPPRKMQNILQIASRLRKCGVGRERRRVLILGLFKAQTKRDCKNQGGADQGGADQGGAGQGGAGPSACALTCLTNQLAALQLASSKLLVGQNLSELRAQKLVLGMKAMTQEMKRATGSTRVFADVGREVLDGLYNDNEVLGSTDLELVEQKQEQESGHTDWRL
jgi:hypothetical protein